MIKLKELRLEREMNMREAAKFLGISYTTYVNYEKGIREPNSETLISMAAAYNVTLDFLVGRESIRQIPAGFEPLPDTTAVPLVGQIACGTPILAEENVESLVSVPAMWHASFVLKCQGDSMAPRIQDGDIVAIRKQPTVETGQIAAVRIDNEATLKRVYLYPDRMILQPENNSFAPIVLVGEELNSVQIEGLAVGLCRGI